MRLMVGSFGFVVIYCSAITLLAGVEALAQADKAGGDKKPETTPPGAAAAPAAAAKGPAAAEFDRQFEDWKGILKELRSLKVKYQSAALADQAKIQQEWTALVEKGNKGVGALGAAGRKGFG